MPVINNNQIDSDDSGSVWAAEYLPTITVPTQLPQNSTLIDNIFTNNLNKYKEVVLGGYGYS